MKDREEVPWVQVGGRWTYDEETGALEGFSSWEPPGGVVPGKIDLDQIAIELGLQDRGVRHGYGRLLSWAFGFFVGSIVTALIILWAWRAG